MGPAEDVSCPRKLLNGLSYECKHYINCNSINAKKKTAKMVEKSKRTPKELVSFRDNFRLYKENESDTSSISFNVRVTIGMELYKKEDFLESVINQCARFGVKLSPQSFLAKCLCLMLYTYKNSDLKVNMTEVPMVYGPLSSFIERND